MGPYCQYYKQQARESYLNSSKKPLESNQSIWRPWEAALVPGDKLNCRFSDCDATFKRDSELKRHENSVHDPNTEKCTECNQEFTRKDNLTRHMNLKHKYPTRKARCEFCSKLLSRQDSATRHKSTCQKNPMVKRLQKSPKKTKGPNAPNDLSRRANLENLVHKI